MEKRNDRILSLVSTSLFIHATDWHTSCKIGMAVLRSEALWQSR